MLIQVERVDVTPAVAAGQPPVFMFKRDIVGDDGLRRVVTATAKLTDSEEWRILQHQLPGPEGRPKWSIDKGNPYIRIPLFAYQLSDTAPEVLVHFGSQTGALAVAMAEKNRKIRKIVLAIGNVFRRPDGQPGYQTWAGFAVCFEKE